jgi:large-conductance mechanosensitive channel
VLRDFQTVVALGHVIELSVAPVFLLTAVGTLLSVMTNRLARIIDRARYHEAKLENASSETTAKLHELLAVLSRRADLIGHAIFLSTSTALLVCTVIALLFLGDYLRYDVSLPIAALFILAMLLLVIGLICFLREVFIAKASLRIGPDRQFRGNGK